MVVIVVIVVVVAAAVAAASHNISHIYKRSTRMSECVTA
jgi:hypothetical protein